MLLFKEKQFKTSNKKVAIIRLGPSIVISEHLPNNVIQGTLESTIFLIITEDRQNNIFTWSYF